MLVAALEGTLLHLSFKALESILDASAELAQLAEALIKQPVEVTTFLQFNASVRFDAVWACASLLHVPFDELPLAFNNLATPLNEGGVFFCSSKMVMMKLNAMGHSLPT